MGSNGYGKLSASFVSRHRKPGTYNDGGNLYLQISSPTAKSWVFRFWDSERARVREMGLGSLHLVSLAQARTLAFVGGHHIGSKWTIQPSAALRDDDQATARA
jgi:hypothetical protein